MNLHTTTSHELSDAPMYVETRCPDCDRLKAELAAARGANNILGEQITKRDAALSKLRALALHNSKLLRHYVTGRHECILPFAIVEALDSLEAAGRGEGE